MSLREVDVHVVGVRVPAGVRDRLLGDAEQRAAGLVRQVDAFDVEPDVDPVAGAPGGGALLDGGLEGQLVEGDRPEADQLVAQGIDVALDRQARVEEQHMRAVDVVAAEGGHRALDLQRDADELLDRAVVQRLGDFLPGGRARLDHPARQLARADARVLLGRRDAAHERRAGDRGDAEDDLVEDQPVLRRRDVDEHGRRDDARDHEDREREPLPVAAHERVGHDQDQRAEVDRGPDDRADDEQRGERDQVADRDAAVQRCGRALAGEPEDQQRERQVDAAEHPGQPVVLAEVERDRRDQPDEHELEPDGRVRADRLVRLELETLARVDVRLGHVRLRTKAAPMAAPTASMSTSTGDAVPAGDEGLVELVGHRVGDGDRVGEGERVPRAGGRRRQRAPPEEGQDRVLGHVRALAQDEVPVAEPGGQVRLRGQVEDQAHEGQRRQPRERSADQRHAHNLDSRTALLTITSKSPYAVRALAELARSGNSGPVPIGEIARRRDIPVQFLEGLFATLRRAGILQSQRGVKGGYSFAKPAEDVTVLDVVEALEGRLGQDATQAGDVWTEAIDALRLKLQAITIAEVAQREARAAGAAMYYI